MFYKSTMKKSTVVISVQNDNYHHVFSRVETYQTYLIIKATKEALAHGITNHNLSFILNIKKILFVVLKFSSIPLHQSLALCFNFTFLFTS